MMTRTDANERTPALLFDQQRQQFSGDARVTLQLHLSVVYLTPANEVRNYLDGIGHEDNGHANLRICAQHDPGTTADGQPYGWRTEYRDVFSIERPRAEAMVKVLRKVERRLERDRLAHGYPPDFATYVARVAHALGITLIGWRVGESRGAYDETTFRWSDIDGFRLHLQTVLTNFNESVKGARA